MFENLHMADPPRPIGDIKVPETKHGACPWCGKTETLYFCIAGRDQDGIWADWICAGCLQKARQAAAMIPEHTEPGE